MGCNNDVEFDGVENDDVTLVTTFVLLHFLVSSNSSGKNSSSSLSSSVKT